MKSSNSNKPPICFRSGIAALVVAMSAAIGTGTVHAAGTASGTSINNLSTLNYSVGGVAATCHWLVAHRQYVGRGHATTFVVDNRVNVTVTTTDATFVSVVPGATAQVTTFSVTNTGNTVQDFALASAQAGERASRCSVAPTTSTPPRAAQFVENGGDRWLSGRRRTPRRSSTNWPLMHHATVYVVCSIPGGSSQQRQRSRDVDRDGACGWRCGRCWVLH